MTPHRAPRLVHHSVIGSKKRDRNVLSEFSFDFWDSCVGAMESSGPGRHAERVFMVLEQNCRRFVHFCVFSDIRRCGMVGRDPYRVVGWPSISPKIISPKLWTQNRPASRSTPRGGWGVSGVCYVAMDNTKLYFLFFWGFLYV